MSFRSRLEQRASTNTQARKKSRHCEHNGETPSSSELVSSTKTRRRVSTTQSTARGCSSSASSSLKSHVPLTLLGNSANSPICIGTQGSTRTDGDVLMASNSPSTTGATTSLPAAEVRPPANTVLEERELLDLTGPLADLTAGRSAPGRRSAPTRKGYDRSTSTKMSQSMSSSSRTQDTRPTTSGPIASSSVRLRSRGVSEPVTGIHEAELDPTPGMDLQRMIRQFGSVVKERTARSSVAASSSSYAGNSTSTTGPEGNKRQAMGRKRMRSATDEGRTNRADKRVDDEEGRRVMSTEWKAEDHGRPAGHLRDRTNQPLKDLRPRPPALVDPNKALYHPPMARTGSGTAFFPKRRLVGSDSDEERYWQNISMESLDLQQDSEDGPPRRTTSTASHFGSTTSMLPKHLPFRAASGVIGPPSPLQSVEEEPLSVEMTNPRIPNVGNVQASSPATAQQSSQHDSVPPASQGRRLGITGHALSKAPPLLSQTATSGPQPGPLSQYSTDNPALHAKPKTLGMRVGGSRQPVPPSSASSRTTRLTGASLGSMRPGGFKVPFRAATGGAVAQATPTPPLPAPLPRAPNMTRVTIEKVVVGRTTVTSSDLQEDTIMTEGGNSAGGGDSSFSFECDADELNEMMAQYD
ncbi:hypothetical protein FRB96_007730 [Tulasnella sp. 330]|nr:hypothetical protein FRB96_007730 [Tulasnella sp. 330]